MCARQRASLTSERNPIILVPRATRVICDHVTKTVTKRNGISGEENGILLVDNCARRTNCLCYVTNAKQSEKDTLVSRRFLKGSSYVFFKLGVGWKDNKAENADEIKFHCIRLVLLLLILLLLSLLILSLCFEPNIIQPNLIFSRRLLIRSGDSLPHTDHVIILLRIFACKKIQMVVCICMNNS